MRVEVDTTQAELLLDELKPPASEFPKGETWERYAGALAMVESLGLSWTRGDDGGHKIISVSEAKHRRRHEPLALFRARPDKIIADLTPDVRSAIARREDTPAELLAILAQDPEWKVRWHVAENPSTPSRTLAALAKEDDDIIKKRVAGNPSTPPETLASLAVQCEERLGSSDGYDSTASILLDFLENPSLTDGLQTKLVEIWNAMMTSLGDGEKMGFPLWASGTLIARNPNMSTTVLDELATCSLLPVREAVAGNPSVSLETLARLVSDPNARVAGAAVRNPAVTPDLLWAAFEEEARGISEPSVLSELGRSPKDYVRYLVAGNRSTPASTLEDLLDDECEEVRREAEFNAGSLLFLRKIALGRHDVRPISLDQAKAYVRSGSLWDRFSKSYRIEERTARYREMGIEFDYIPSASRNCLGDIAASPNLPEDLRRVILTLDSKTVLRGIAANPTTTPETLAELADSDDPEVRTAVARNSATGDDILRRLAKDDSEPVRIAVARNTSSGPETLRLLCHDASVDVRFAIVTNWWSAPDDLLKENEEDESWLKDWRQHWQRERTVKNPSLGIDMLQELLNDENEAVRATAAAKELVTAPVLSRLADDQSELVRKSVASNQNTTAETLLSLARDGCRSVQLCAWLNPSLRLFEVSKV